MVKIVFDLLSKARFKSQNMLDIIADVVIARKCVEVYLKCGEGKTAIIQALAGISTGITLIVCPLVGIEKALNSCMGSDVLKCALII